jgi:hypothetical protein
MTVTANGANREFALNGSTYTNVTLTVNSVSTANRPFIFIVNANQDTSTASNGRTFFGWLPISIGVGASQAQTTKWIPLYD